MPFLNRREDPTTQAAPREVPPIDLQLPELLRTATLGSG